MIEIKDIPEEVISAIKEHAEDSQPMEACGVVIIKRGRMMYTPCRNMAEDPKEQFEMDLTDIIRAEDSGTPVIVVHSHPFAPPEPSEADRVRCEQSGLQWLIVNYPVGSMVTLEPDGYMAPLEGRSYTHGILDCFSLIRDYYKRVLNIELKDYERLTNWWERGRNLYMDNYVEAGFVKIPIEEMKIHDMMLFQHDSVVPNHGGVWLGDNWFLHHLPKRLSSRDVYSGYWRKMHTLCLRHGSLM